MYNAITLSKKVKQTLPTFQGYGPARYRKGKIDIVMTRERGPRKEQEKVKGTKRGETLIHALKKRLKERERRRKPL